MPLGFSCPPLTWQEREARSRVLRSTSPCTQGSSQDWGGQTQGQFPGRLFPHKVGGTEIWAETPAPFPRRLPLLCGVQTAVTVGQARQWEWGVGRGRWVGGIRTELRPCLGFEMPKLLI